jgi:hypothetical protein
MTRRGFKPSNPHLDWCNRTCPKIVRDRGLEARDQQENGLDDDARAKFLEPMRDIMYIIDGPNTSNRKQKLEAR